MIYEKHSKHLEASIWLSIELPAYHHCNVFSTQNGFTRWFCLLHVMFQVCIITLFCSLSYMNWVNSEVTLCQNHSIILYLPNIYVTTRLSPLRAMEHQTLRGQICLLFIDSKIQSRKPWKTMHVGRNMWTPKLKILDWLLHHRDTVLSFYWSKHRSLFIFE